MTSIEHFRQDLGDNLLIRSISAAEFKDFWSAHYQAVFGDKARMDMATILSPEETENMEKLSQHMGTPLCLRFGLFQGTRFVGWHVGDQKSREEFYMRNSGILPDVQGQGLYTKMLGALLPHIKSLGFQVIASKHNATNNRVIIPKLRVGFTITGLELSDRFGTLVRLEYFTNPTRRTVMDYRCGQQSPNDQLKRILGYM